MTKRNPSRWEKGCTSPNPKGRPPKPKTKSRGLFATVNADLASFLAADRKVVATDENGEDITRGDSLNLHLFRGAMTDPRMMKIYLDRKTIAADSEREVREAALIAAMEYQNKYLPLAIAAEKRGGEFILVPHPLDIVIRGLEFSIVGPLTELDRLRVKGIVVQRDLILETVETLWESPVDMEGRREIWLYLRRRHYRLQAKLPPRLKKPFPRWRTPHMIEAD